MTSNLDLNVGKVSFARKLTIDEVNIRLQEVERLSGEYNVSEMLIGRNPIAIDFKSTMRSYGFVSPKQGANGTSLDLINFGSASDPYTPDSREFTRGKYIKTRESSRADEGKAPIATVTHEFAHVISTARQLNAETVAPNISSFWGEIKKHKEDYQNELVGFFQSGDNAGLNEISLGKYANTNYDEFFAEGFTEYHNSSNPSKYAKLIGESVDKHFKKKKK